MRDDLPSTFNDAHISGSATTFTHYDVSSWQRHLGRDDVLPVVGDLDSGTLPHAIAATAHTAPDKPALLFPEQSDHWLTHGEVTELSARTGGWLADHGVGTGTAVLLCGNNTASLVIAYLAVLRCGATVVLASPDAPVEELARLVEDSGAEWALADQPAARSVSRSGASELHGLTVVSLEEPLPQATPRQPAAIDSSTLAMLAYTSGTTGAPKGVRLSHGNLLASIRAAMLAWRFTGEDVLVHALPLTHQHGLGGVHAALLAGAGIVVLPRFEPARLTGALREHAASVLFAVPAIYERLTRSDEFASALAALRLCVSGSAPLDPELADAVTRVAGAPPLERYGSTETGLDVSNPLDGPRLPGTVGVPLPGVELRLADESGAAVPTGAEGEILLRGPQVCAGYWNQPDATAEAFHGSGWFRTGDLGRIDERTGYLSITGRLKELIISGGLNVSPREVEVALERHPAVAEAGVAGLPSRRWGEQVTAWVVASEDATLDPDEIADHAKTLLAAHQRPKEVFAVDSLPRNPMGKLQRTALPRLLDQHRHHGRHLAP